MNDRHVFSILADGYRAWGKWSWVHSLRGVTTLEASPGSPTPWPARPQSPKCHWEVWVGEVHGREKETLNGLCLCRSDRDRWRTNWREGAGPFMEPSGPPFILYGLIAGRRRAGCCPRLGPLGFGLRFQPCLMRFGPTTDSSPATTPLAPADRVILFLVGGAKKATKYGSTLNMA